MRVFITGATGYIGSALASALRNGGHEVHAVRRGPKADPASMWDADTGWVRSGAFEGADAVVHLGGVSIGAKRWTEDRKRLLRSSRIDSTRVLAEHLARLEQPPKTLITASAVGYYGNGGDEHLTDTAAQGEGFLAALIADWEAAAQPARDRGIRVVHARFAPVIGPKSELLQRMLPFFRLGAGGRIGSGRQWFSWVALQDLVRAVEFLLAHDEISGAVNITSPNPVTNNQLTKALGHAVHRPTLLPVPTLALDVLFGSELTQEVLLWGQRGQPTILQNAGFRFDIAEVGEALAVALDRPAPPRVRAEAT